jgi:hypothetical protein
LNCRPAKTLECHWAEKGIGLVSIGDLVKSIISDQKFVIDQLEHFIRG